MPPLSGLTALQDLKLERTKVNDVSHCISLVWGGTNVIDVSPLSGLIAPQSLDLNGTPVADVSAPAHTTGLKITGKRRRRLAPILKPVVTRVRVT